MRWHCPPDTGFEIRTLAVLRPITLPLGHRGSPQYWLSHVDGEETFFVSFKPPRPGTEPRTLAWKAAVLTTTLGPPPIKCLRVCGNLLQRYIIQLGLFGPCAYKVGKQSPVELLVYCLYKLQSDPGWPQESDVTEQPGLNSVAGHWGIAVQLQLDEVTWLIADRLIVSSWTVARVSDWHRPAVSSATTTSGCYLRCFAGFLFICQILAHSKISLTANDVCIETLSTPIGW